MKQLKNLYERRVIMNVYVQLHMLKIRLFSQLVVYHKVVELSPRAFRLSLAVLSLSLLVDFAFSRVLLENSGQVLGDALRIFAVLRQAFSCFLSFTMYFSFFLKEQNNVFGHFYYLITVLLLLITLFYYLLLLLLLIYPSSATLFCYSANRKTIHVKHSPRIKPCILCFA